MDSSALSDAERKEHALNRLGLGISPGESARYDALGFTAYIDDQLARAHNLSAQQVSVWMDEGKPNGDAPTLNHIAATQLQKWEYYQRWHLTRPLVSELQLLEVLVDFWWNHFNVSAASPNEVASWEGWTSYYAGIAQRVLGPFEDLLRFAAMSHSMQDYLDNVYNTVDEPNENLGREILELHTMGIDGGYTQADVVAASQILTGWQGGVALGGQGVPSGPAPFSFVAGRHDARAKTFLGVEFPAGADGLAEQDQFLSMIASHPSTHRYVSSRLCEMLVADEPPSTLVDSTTQTWTATDGDLYAVTSHILHSSEFNSRTAFRAKAKKPRTFAVSTARALGRTTAAQAGDAPSIAVSQGDLPEYEAQSALTRFCFSAGEVLFFNTVPTGYPNVAEFWLSGMTLAQRFDYVTAAAQNWTDTVGIDAELPTEELVDAVQATTAPGGFQPITRATIVQRVDELAGADRLQMAIWLALASPEFARY